MEATGLGPSNALPARIPLSRPAAMLRTLGKPGSITRSDLPADFEITSPEDDNYNCISWTVGDTEHWWWPTQFEFPCYWPAGLACEANVDSFAALYEDLLYTSCDEIEPEAGYDKVALYASAEGEPTHAARCLIEDGGWTSKLGKSNDILHHTLVSLEGDIYGRVVRVFRRKRAL